MIFLDVLYIGLSTISVMAVLQLVTFVIVKILYPPQPQIIYRQVPVQVQPPPQIPQEKHVAFTQSTQEVVLPEYEPRTSAISTSLRLDSQLPDGIQETSPARI